MKKTINLENFLFFAAILLGVGFVIRLAADYYEISIGASSAPLWLFAAVRAVVFLVPAAACLIVSHVMKKRRLRDVKA